GREHAFAWKIRQSQSCKKLYIAPGNAGTRLVGENVAIKGDDFEKLGQFCLDNQVSMVVVGPEAPLVKGIRDYFESKEELRHILLVGPGKSGARLEGSKDFSKQFMLRHDIPTARAKTFTADEIAEARRYVSALQAPVVLKADGLAAGKGVVISQTHEE